MPDTARRTATLAGARDHARGLAGGVTGPATAATVPVTDAVDLPAGVDPARLRWDETLGAGGYAARRLPRDTILRISDLDGDACVNLQVFVGANPIERLNPADTVKVQWQAYLGEGALLLSDQGRALMTFVADTSGTHDALCGHLNRAAATAKYGDGGVHTSTPNARDLLALAGSRFGLGHRDLTAGVNLFRQVRVDDDGSLHLGDAPGPSHVELRAELDLVVLLANVPHPLDDRPTYTSGTVRITAWAGPRPTPDPFRDTSPERLRAFENTEDLLRGASA